MSDYRPDEQILKRYADVLVKYALNSGDGIRPGEVVQVILPDVAKPLYGPLQQSILESGGHPLMRYMATGYTKQYFELANDEQLGFFPEAYLKERAALIDHSIAILAEHDLHELEQIEPKKIMLATDSKMKMRKWLNDKEAQGKFTWTLALYGTPAMAAEAKMSLEAYWEQIIKACFLNEADPIQRWKRTNTEIERIGMTLTDMKIELVHVVSEGTDLRVRIGEKRKWLGGSGRNIPSFELFTSPDWRGTEGIISFNQPLYRYGKLVEGIKLKFAAGKVVKAQAEKNESLLKEMIGRDDADKVGEFSLTDARFSQIDKFMANTLYDENVGGPHGNTHIAIGMSYKDAYAGDVATVAKEELDELGFNNIYCSEHCDMMSTTDRTVIATLFDGTEVMIYKNGQFQI